MKKILTYCLMLCLPAGSAFSQVLNVKQVIQEQTEWCWAGVSACILDLYGHPASQCTIAEYTRTVSNSHYYGGTNCCTNPSLGCNYSNYNWGYNGSIQDILVHFASITNSGMGRALTLTEVQAQLNNRQPFVVRWGWTSGGGHFVVGHGVSGNNVYYMNPWPGEGMKIASYNWLSYDGSHSWTHTNVLSVGAPQPQSIQTPVPVKTTDSVCIHQPAAFSVQPLSGATYSWNVDGAWSAGSNTSVSPVFHSAGAKQVKVRYKVGSDSSAAYVFSTVVKDLPGKPVLVSKPDSLCLNAAATFTLDTASGKKFSWYMNGERVGDSMYIATRYFGTAGTQSVKVFGKNECGTGTDSLVVTSYVVAPAKPSITFNSAAQQLECSISGTQYEWYRDQSVLPAQDRQITPVQNGAYQVKYRSVQYNCESPLSDAYQYTAPTTGMDELNGLLQKVYPNPCDQVLYVEGNAAFTELSDMTGKVLISGEYTAAGINTSALAPGMYVLKASAPGHTSVRKICIAHP